MLVNKKLGNLSDQPVEENIIDWLPIEWYEAGKRMQRKTTLGGEEFILRFLDEAPDFAEGDILFRDHQRVVAIQMIPCECLVIEVTTMYEMASLAYEIGNKHLPLFYDGALKKAEAILSFPGHSDPAIHSACLLVPMDQPLSRLLTAQGYRVSVQHRKLLQPLKTTVSPHGNSSGTSLFSRIMQLTNPDK